MDETKNTEGQELLQTLDDGRQEPTPYHNAAFNVFCYRLREYKENGDVELFNEHQLSKEPLQIDIVVIKKNRDIELEPTWAKIFRPHNIVEYKSPADKPPTLAVFNKLIGYANIYAAQEKVKISDVTATLICAGTPRKLLKTLKNEFDYEILQKYDGIYYITKKGTDAEKDLAIQVAVQNSDLLLQALDKKALNDVTADKVADFMLTAGEDSNDMLGYWFKALAPENIKNISERMKDDMKRGDLKREKVMMKIMDSWGFSDRLRQEGMQVGRQVGIQEGRQEGIQEGRQEGIQEGMQKGVRNVFELLESGCSVAEAKRKLQLVLKG